jgi:branched-chain amino acid aminotransferase
MEIKITKATSYAAKPQDESNLGFGRIFTDYMFIMDYTEGKGWHDARIEPFHNLCLHPASTILHYGQAIFEGMKAYRSADDKVLLFRAKDNFRRMNTSAERLCMPTLDVDETYNALVELLRIDKDWVPHQTGTSLYIRPTMIGVEDALGVKAASHYIFFIICSPSGAYYPSGLKPVAIYVEDEYVRAAKGGTGHTKTGGNYAASLMPAELAHKRGYTQVLWLDSAEHKYVEEVGAMNMFFLVDGKLLTAPLDGSILAGITRDSVIKLAADMGVKTEERRIPIQEIYDANVKGLLQEAFGTGTAAVVSPVGSLCWDGKIATVQGGKMGELTQKLYDQLTGIQYGVIADTHNWVTEVK